jgi:uncharacterized protein (DUF362 family)
VNLYYEYMSRVIVVKFNADKAATNLSEEAYGQILTAGLHRLSQQGNLKAAVRTFLPSGVVGMKTNCLAGKANSTPVALIDALAGLLLKAGFADNDIVVWERTNRELAGAGYTLNASNFGRRCLGTDANGVGYSSDFYSSGDVSSLVSRILTELVVSNINVPILKDHSVAGLSAGMKNMYGAIHNPNKYHANNCDPYCAHVSNLEPVRSKTRLTILDAVKVQYNGGPGYMGDYLYNYGGIVVSDDPAAADRVGLEILERIRSLKGQPSLEKAGRPVKYLASAEQIGLGVADLSKIDLSVIEVRSDGTLTAGVLF